MCWLWHTWGNWAIVRRIQYVDPTIPEPRLAGRGVVQSRTCTRCGFIQFDEQDA